MKQPIAKTIQSQEEYFIQFTDEELKELKLEKGQKYTCEVEDGAIKMVPYAKVELEISEWPREILEYLIKLSCEQDVSVNEVINDALKEVIKNGKL